MSLVDSNESFRNGETRQRKEQLTSTGECQGTIHWRRKIKAIISWICVSGVQASRENDCSLITDMDTILHKIHMNSSAFLGDILLQG